MLNTIELVQHILYTPILYHLYSYLAIFLLIERSNVKWFFLLVPKDSIGRDLNMMHLSDLFHASPDMFDFYDINLEEDTPRFIEPGCIFTASDELSRAAWADVQDCFQCIFLAYQQKASNPEKIELLSHLHEINATKLGYGNGRNGKAKTPEGMLEVFSQLDALFDNGIEVSHPLDLPLFFYGYGADCLSDALTNILFDRLSHYTYEQAQMWGVDEQYFSYSQKPEYYWDITAHRWQVCQQPQLVFDGQQVLLVPKRWLRTRILCDTVHFLRHMILHTLQAQQTTYLDGRAIRPTIKGLDADLREKYGAPREIIKKFVRENPSLLTKYHRNLADFYHQNCSSD